MSKRKERMKELVKYAEEIVDDEGYAVIDVRLPEGKDLYNPLSTGANLDLNGDIYDFIDQQANIIPSKIPLKIRFHGNVDKDKQDEIRQLMHRHYTMRSYDVTWDFAANFRKAIFLTVFGIAVLIAYFLVTVLVDNPLFAEILSIVGSFSLWEAANAILLDRPALRRSHDAIEQNINQRLEFVPDENDENLELNDKISEQNIGNSLENGANSRENGGYSEENTENSEENAAKSEENAEISEGNAEDRGEEG